MIKRIVIFVCLFIFLCNTSFATRITKEEKSCPLCGTKFMASVVLSSNNFGGTDHDLCPHARGASPIEDYVWGCPYCNFCGFSGDFKKSYTDEEKNTITNWLKENYPPTIEKPTQDEAKKTSDEDEDFEESSYRRNQYRADSLPSYIRYEIAAKLAKLTNKSNYVVGKLYLSASWCARANVFIAKDQKDFDDYQVRRYIESNSSIIREESGKVESSLDQSEAMNFTMADLFLKVADNVDKLNLTDEKEKFCSYSNLAIMLRSSGENTRAEEYIKKAEQCEDAQKATELFEALRNSIKIESSYQSKVIEFLSAALKDGINEDQQLEATLLLGEMNRRLGKYEEAQKYYSILLEKSDKIPELFMRTVKFATKVMGVNDDKQQEVFDKIEEKRIYSYLKSLGEPFNGDQAAMFLSASNRRDIIYPKLAEIINDAAGKLQKAHETENEDETTGNKTRVRFIIPGDSDPETAFENAIRAMTDETKEAAELLYGLLDKGLNERLILIRLKATAYYLPSEKFIKRFNDAKTSDEIEEYAIILKVIGDKPSFEALITKAEKMLNDEGLKNLVYKSNHENNFRACNTLVDSLAFFRGKRTIDFLVNLCERILKISKQIEEEKSDKKINTSNLKDLYKKAGTAFEIMFFRHFGFNSYRISRTLEPKELESLLEETIQEKPVKKASVIPDPDEEEFEELRNLRKTRILSEEPLNNFKQWYSQHGNENYKNIIYEGFKKYGYDIQPVNDPKKLYILVEGLSERFYAAKIQCYKELIRRTGVRIRPDAGLDSDFMGREEHQSLVGGYQKWLEKNISKLVYDEKNNRFIIK